MKDERLPTLTNDRGQAEPTADELRIMLGQRIRTARLASGLSQQAVADEMATFGFNWRQTTVAKVEAADRPTLFTEVVALGRIFQRDMAFFYSARDALDDMIDELSIKTTDLKKRAENTYREFKILEDSLAAAVIEEGMALAILAFRRHGDSGELRRSMDLFANSSSFSLHLVSQVLQVAGIPKREIQAADHEAIREVAAVTLMEAAPMSVEQLQDSFTGEHLLNAAALIRGGEVDPTYLRYVRNDLAWRSHISQMLVDLVVSYGQ